MFERIFLLLASCCGGAHILHLRFWPQLNPTRALAAQLYLLGSTVLTARIFANFYVGTDLWLVNVGDVCWKVSEKKAACMHLWSVFLG